MGVSVRSQKDIYSLELSNIVEMQQVNLDSPPEGVDIILQKKCAILNAMGDSTHNTHTNVTRFFPRFIRKIFEVF